LLKMECPWLAMKYSLGPFEEEVKGVSAASDVVKAEGRDPANPGFPKWDGAKWYVGDSRS